MSERAGAVRDGGREDVRDGERKARRASEESEEKLEKLEKEGDVDRCWSRVEEAVLWALARVLVAVAGAWSACCWGAGEVGVAGICWSNMVAGGFLMTVVGASSSRVCSSLSWGG